MKKSIILASHRFGNIGHSFMAVGMEEAIKHTYDKTVDVQHIEQHYFFEVYPKLHPLRMIHLAPHSKFIGVKNILNTRKISELLWKTAKNYKNSIGLIECGGPTLTAWAGNEPNIGLIFNHQLGAISSQGIPALDLGLGSCFPLSDIPDEISDPINKSYWNRVFELTATTSVRDKKAHEIISKLGRVPILLACAAFLTGYFWEGKGYIHNISNDNYIIINYQLYGSNEDWGQSVDVDKWKETVLKFANYFSRNNKVIFLCHNKKEKDLALSLGLPNDVILPQNEIEYGKIISKARFGLVNRIHAAIPLASMGIPSLVVGNDTRLGAIEILGLKTFFTKDITAEILIEHATELEKKLSEEKERLNVYRTQVREQYKEVFQKFCLPV